MKDEKEFLSIAKAKFTVQYANGYSFNYLHLRAVMKDGSEYRDNEPYTEGRFSTWPFKRIRKRLIRRMHTAYMAYEDYST